MLLLALVCQLPSTALAQQTPPDSSQDSTTVVDSNSVAFIDGLLADSTALDSTAQDSLVRRREALVSDSLQALSDFTEVVTFRAADSIVLVMPESSMRMYEQAYLDYERRNVAAARVDYNWQEGTFEAYGVPDSTDSTGVTMRDEPVFTDQGQVYNTERIRYNFKSQKAVIVYTRATLEDNVVYIAKSKRQPDGSFYARDGVFTTCTHDPPHYYIRSRKLKVIPGEQYISGPLYMVVADVPLPVVVPFGFFPQSDKRQSGILFPTFGEDRQRGFNLRNGGYYWAASDNLDLTLRGDVYTRGSWRAELSSTYNVLYKLSGNFRFQYALNQFNEPEDPDFNTTRNFNLTLAHNQPINPTTRISASVNFGSSSFFRQSSYSIQDYFTNTMASSVAFQKQWLRSGWNLTANLNHSQNTRTEIVNLTLPQLTINKSRFFPLRRKVQVGGRRWYEDIGVTYQVNATNQVTISEQNLFRPEMFDSLRYGLVHNASISTNFKLFRYLVFTPSVSYREYWYGESVEPVFFEQFGVEPGAAVPVTDTTLFTNEGSYRAGVAFLRNRGFAAAREFNLSLNMNTTLYGVFQTGNERQRAYRHIIRPTLTYSYRPDFSAPAFGFYREVPTDTLGTTQRFSRFRNGILGGPGAGTSQSMTFSLQNIFETKALQRRLSDEEASKSKAATEAEDGEEKFVYTTLIDNIGLTATYNFAADSLRLSNIPVSIRTTFLKGSLALQGNLGFDPYAFDSTNTGFVRVNTFELDRSNRLARLTSARLALTGRISSDRFARSQTEDTPQLSPEEEILAAAEPQLRPELDARARLRQRYVNFNIPWNLDVSYNMTYTQPFDVGRTTQSLNISGELRLTNKWRIQVSSGYDFTAREITFTSISVFRDLHCWQLSFNAIPFGFRQSYNLTIGVRAAALQDLKLTKRRDWQDTFVPQ